MPFPYHSWKGALLKPFREFGVFKAWATSLLAWPSMNLSLLQILTFGNKDKAQEHLNSHPGFDWWSALIPFSTMAAPAVQSLLQRSCRQNRSQWSFGGKFPWEQPCLLMQGIDIPWKAFCRNRQGPSLPSFQRWKYHSLRWLRVRRKLNSLALRFRDGCVYLLFMEKPVQTLHFRDW